MTIAEAVAPAITIVPYHRAHHGRGPWRVVNAVFEEYGFPFAESDYDADVSDPATYYDGASGWFAVAESANGGVVGCIGVTDEGDGLFELHRLYVLAEARRGGTGRRLVEWVFATARAHGCQRMVLFSDVHFEDAHRLYTRSGFRCNRFRYAPDPFASREWGFVRDMTREDAR